MGDSKLLILTSELKNTLFYFTSSKNCLGFCSVMMPLFRGALPLELPSAHLADIP